MHSRKNIILLWVMLSCAVFMISGCKKDTGEENDLVSVEQADIPVDIRDGEGVESTDAEDGAEEKNLGGSKENSEVDEAGSIYVDVCGQVKNPGVYQLTEESRVYEAIERAGGMTSDAAAASVNQAERLADGQQIYIPSKEEQQEGHKDADGGNIKAGTADNGKVNLNTATKEELLSLTGIGDVKADSIIKYREEHGDFQSVEDVKKIEGIKDGVFNKIKDQITV